jgi:PPK2 family polyphosphate:nucleotide phosphotransferase
MDIDAETFRVGEGEVVDLDQRPTKVKPVYKSKAEYRDLLEGHVRQLSKLQYRFYAANTYSLLLIFQGMDAAGKDSAIEHVMSGVNPQGCQVYSFSHPTVHELEHDFLWRTSQCLPERGRIGIFNRSYYEEVLIVRVHPEILHGENLPPSVLNDGSIWQQRFRSIVDHEAHLHRNGMIIRKFFLHISPEEQRQRFLDRIDDPEKNWKFSIADVDERRYWPQYMEAYAAALSTTSTEEAPWYVIPADDKQNARLFVSQIILSALESAEIGFPQLTEERLQELKVLREKLIAEPNPVQDPAPPIL